MNYANIIPASAVDFEGWSTILQVSGCDFRCKNCFNASAQNPRFGKEFTEDVYQEFISHASKPFINSVVLQGGDILSRFNYREGIELCRKLKRDLPDKNIVIFTGYTYEDLQNDLLRQPALLVADYIVDGQYEHDKPTKKPFRGSDRQRILHLSSTGTILGES